MAPYTLALLTPRKVNWIHKGSNPFGASTFINNLNYCV